MFYSFSTPFEHSPLMYFCVSAVLLSQQSTSWSNRELWGNWHLPFHAHAEFNIANSRYEKRTRFTNTPVVCAHVTISCLTAEARPIILHHLLFLEGDLYSAAPLDADGSFLQFRRKAGGRTSVWMYENWVTGNIEEIDETICTKTAVLKCTIAFFYCFPKLNLPRPHFYLCLLGAEERWPWQREDLCIL